MTTTDLYIVDRTCGLHSVSRNGYLFSDAGKIARVLWEFLAAKRAEAEPGHFNVANMATTMDGALVLEMLQETERRTGKALLEGDGTPTCERISPSCTYRVSFIEF